MSALTWTYGNPADSDLWALRLTIHDTDSTAPEMYDEELLWLLSRHGTVRKAAIAACATLEAKYATSGVDKKVGDLEIKASTRSANFRSLRRALIRDAALVAAPAAGGISISDKLNTERDTDRTTPAFRRGMNDEPSFAQPGGRAGSMDDPYDYGA